MAVKELEAEKKETAYVIAPSPPLGCCFCCCCCCCFDPFSMVWVSVTVTVCSLLIL